jgi:hypothetical protein
MDCCVVWNVPTKEPVTVITKLTAAGPLVARSQSTVIRLPSFAVSKLTGASGTPEQGPGNVSVRVLDESPTPAAFAAWSASV